MNFEKYKVILAIILKDYPRDKKIAYILLTHTKLIKNSIKVLTQQTKVYILYSVKGKKKVERYEIQ